MGTERKERLRWEVRGVERNAEAGRVNKKEKEILKERKTDVREN